MLSWDTNDIAWYSLTHCSHGYLHKTCIRPSQRNQSRFQQAAQGSQDYKVGVGEEGRGSRKERSGREGEREKSLSEIQRKRERERSLNEVTMCWGVWVGEAWVESGCAQDTMHTCMKLSKKIF